MPRVVSDSNRLERLHALTSKRRELRDQIFHMRKNGQDVTDLIKTRNNLKKQVYYLRHRESISKQPNRIKYWQRKRIHAYTKQIEQLKTLPADFRISQTRTASEKIEMLESKLLDFQHEVLQYGIRTNTIEELPQRELNKQY